MQADIVFHISILRHILNGLIDTGSIQSKITVSLNIQFWFVVYFYIYIYIFFFFFFKVILNVKLKVLVRNCYYIMG